MMIALKSFFINDSGVTAIEYALLASLIMLVIVTVMGVIGQKTTALYQSVGAAFP
jgi:Flp pilus assembly pilin Flp